MKILIIATLFTVLGFICWEKAIAADNSGKNRKAVKFQNACNISLGFSLIYVIIFVIRYWQGI